MLYLSVLGTYVNLSSLYLCLYCFILADFLFFQMVSMGRRRFGTDFQLMFRILKGLLFLGFISVMTVLFVVCGLTIGDVFASILGFMPTGWSILLVSAIVHCRVLRSLVACYSCIIFDQIAILLLILVDRASYQATSERCQILGLDQGAWKSI